MKIKMNFGTVKTVVCTVILLGVLAVVGLDIAILAGAKGVEASPAVPAVSMVAAFIVGVACALLLLNSYYKFKEQYLLIMLGFFWDKVSYGDIALVKQDMESGELYLIVNDLDKKGADESEKTQIALKVNASKRGADAFLSQLRKRVPSIEVDFFEKPKKNDDDEKGI